MIYYNFPKLSHLHEIIINLISLRKRETLIDCAAQLRRPIRATRAWPNHARRPMMARPTQEEPARAGKIATKPLN
jgi:hypothetical protein